MKRLFISQPMKDKTDEEILSERQRIIEKAETALNEPLEVINSFIQDPPLDAAPLWYLGRSFEFLSTADVAVFGKGWENYRGCKMEHAACLEYGIDIIEIYSE